MANTFFKSLTESDRTSSRTLLHEAIPITGTLVSGTYNAAAVTKVYSGGGGNGDGTGTPLTFTSERELNVKSFSHGMFQSVYDYPYLSSSANHIFDITVGVAPHVPFHDGDFQGDFTSATERFDLVVTGSGMALAKKKRAIYNQMAQTLVGYDTSGSIRLFDSDGDFALTNDWNPGNSTSTQARERIARQKIQDPIFFNFSRLLVKDEIKKGSFSFVLGVNKSWTDPMQKTITIADTGADSNYFVNSPAGEFGLLKATNLKGTPMQSTDYSAVPIGLIYYQAGIVVLDGTKVFRETGGGGGSAKDRDGILASGESCIFQTGSSRLGTGGAHYNILLNSSSIDNIADNIRNRISNISFNNTTELNSTIYFCRANHNEFNYSSNTTYLSGSQIRVKGGEELNPPKSFVTTVGMYSADNELLAVAKLSEPLRKDPTNELTLRVRLDY